MFFLDLTSTYIAIDLNIFNYNCHDNNIDLICLDTLGCDVKYRLICAYVPPHADECSISGFLSLLENDKFTGIDASFVICGDFNMPSNSSLKPLLHITEQIGFSQCVEEPTLGNNILDLVFVNDQYALFDLEVIEPFCTSDHSSVVFKLVYDKSVGTMYNQTKQVRYNFSKANWSLIVESTAAVDWGFLFSGVNYDSIWKVFF